MYKEKDIIEKVEKQLKAHRKWRKSKRKCKTLENIKAQFLQAIKQ